MRRPTSSGNRLQGLAFEDRFLTEAKYQGLYAHKNHIAAKYGWKGRLIPLPGNLDYRLIDPRTGKVGMFDCKSFSLDCFTYSDIDPDQLEQSVLLNECRVPSGFVVWFVPSGSIVFYAGIEIAEDGPKKKFTPSMGLRLGHVFDFDLRPLLGASSASKRKRRYKDGDYEDDGKVEEFRHPLFISCR